MTGIEKILMIIELALWTAYVKGEQEVSVLLTATVESGKTMLIMKFSLNSGIVVLTDATAYGIMHDYKQQIIARKIRHIVIPDMIKPMSRGKDTVHSLVAFLNSLVEEGVLRVSTYAESMGAPNTSSAELNIHAVPVKCGLITTLAKSYLLDGRHHWAKMGFMSRMLPVSYSYNPATKMEIHKSIAERKYISDTPIKLGFPTDDVEIKLELPEANQLMNLTNNLTSVQNRTNSEKIYGFRLQKQLQRLAMAAALREGRAIVEQKDVDLLHDLSTYMNLDYYPM